MALNNINLDDKRWALIAEEARLLIPSFAPEWTDHNVHDPGITILELFAWLEEIQRYRLNRTSAPIRDRFFAMAGVLPAPAKPATALVEFKPDGITQPCVFVAAKTGLSLTSHPDIPYRTVRDSYLLAASIAAIETDAGGRELDRTQAERDPAGHFDAFGPAPGAGDSLMITLDRAVSAPEVALAFHVFDGDLPPIRTGALPVPSVVLRWEYSTATGTWAPLTVSRDTTAALTLSGFVVLSDPGTTFQKLRVVIVSGNYEIAPRLYTVRLNVLEAEQVGVAAPALEKATGYPDQERKLPLTPVSDTTPIIRVGPEGSEEDWALVADLAASDPTSKHYTFDHGSATIRFGNGLNGKIPGEGFRIVVKPFAYTLGDAGNLNQGMNWRLEGLPQASAWFGTNAQPTWGGSDAESADDTELRARGQFRSVFRGVTAADLEQLALETPGIRVARAKALAGWNPFLPCTPTMDDITVVVLPAARPDLDSEAPSPGFLKTVRRHLESARLLASRFHVIATEFVPIDLTATITLQKQASSVDVRRSVLESLHTFLSPQTWPFGRDIFPSELHQRLTSIAGVAFASRLRINGKAAALPLRPAQLPRLGQVNLEILEARDV